MSARQRLQVLCDSFGLTLEVHRFRHVTACVMAPQGFHFSTGIHEVVQEGDTVEAACKEAIERVEEELPCEVCGEECEWWD